MSGILLNGEEFNKQFGKYKPFCKILTEDFVHRKVQYKIGEITTIDPIEKFKSYGSCQSGGLYFTSRQKVCKFIDFGTQLGIVKIPDDAKVYIDGSDENPNLNIFQSMDDDQVEIKFKTDKLYLEFVVNPIPYDIYLSAVRQNGNMMEFVPKIFQSEREICLAAVQNNGMALEFLPEELYSDREICLAAVQNNGSALIFLPKELQSDREICLAAISQNKQDLDFIEITL